MVGWVTRIFTALLLWMTALHGIDIAQAAPTATQTGGKTAPLADAKKTAAEPILRVGLATGQGAAIFSATGEYVVRDGETGQGLAKFSSNVTLTVASHGGQFLLNGKPVSAKTLVVTRADPRSSPSLLYNGTAYRGEFRLLMENGGAITVINNVSLEDYVGGVIGAEMGTDWPPEALRAQAVAARTFALYSLGRHNAEGFDVCPDTHCQVYKGLGAESKSGLAAVSSTRGEVMMYAGKPIYAAFHAAAGGWTAGNEEAGGDPVPYLKPVRDEATYRVAYHWQVPVSAAEVSAKLRKAGFDLGVLKRVELSPLSEEMRKETTDRYVSGRVRTVRFVGTLRTVDLPGTKLRWLFGLPSTRFDVRHQKGTTTVPNRNGKIEFHGQSSETLLFDGWGRGHGLGMSQWGAYAMADKKDYRAILSHYYTNIEIVKLY
ncbi:MAG: SpoIID/LytB domain-containing protein [Schwartzia sp. (in: firmicutes)]